jgi:hypothetical protein
MNSLPLSDIPHLFNPLTCQGTFKSFSHLGYCEECCNEHGVLIFLRDLDFNSLDECSEVELLHLMVVLFTFLRKIDTVSTGAAPFYIFTKSSSFPTSSANNNMCYLFFFFNNSHPNRYEVIFHCGF